MKKISIVIPCYNEEENVKSIAAAVTEEIKRSLPNYDYEILFADNKSKDQTRKLIRELCAEDSHIKAIFNQKNFGQFNSPYYALTQAAGDCAILMCCDFQDPIDMIPKFVKKWEEGNKVVCAVKTSSKENPIMYFLRSCYYKMIRKMSEVDQIEHFTGFGLYDQSFIEIMKKLDDPTPFLRGVVAEYAPDRVLIPYEQQKRRAGKTHNNWFTLYDAAMLSFTSYTKVGLRIATIVGFAVSGLSFLVGLIYLILKLIYWDRFAAGQAPLILIMCFMSGIQMFFIGLMGEYILNINTRVIHRPIVIEEERLNFPEEEKQ